ncbi:hypothetical protein ABIA16_000106 [Sinorhizobium fredii]
MPRPLCPLSPRAGSGLVLGSNPRRGAIAEPSPIRDGADHRRIGAKIIATAEGGVQGVFVFDLEIPD